MQKHLKNSCFFFFSIHLELPCDSNPEQCRNGATCINDNTGGNTCVCPNGYTGGECETREFFLNKQTILFTNKLDIFIYLIQKPCHAFYPRRV